MAQLCWIKLLLLVGLATNNGVSSKTVMFKVSARQLITLETSESDRPDPYIKVFFPENSKIKETAHQSDTQYPVFGDIITINFNEGTTDLVKIEVWDRDRNNFWNPDDRIGTVFMHPKDMGMGIERELRGKNNLWAGRITIQVTCSENC